jgi:predicted nucleic acid-binding Zn ribbon protein
MPTYLVECHECGTTRDQRLSYSDYDAVKEGKKTLTCKNCGLEAKIGFAPGNLGFVLKEGESGGWATKSIKENAYRKKRREELAQKERDHVFKASLQPNFDGVETGTWKDAQELARKEKGDLSASTYDPLVKGPQVVTS